MGTHTHTHTTLPYIIIYLIACVTFQIIAVPAVVWWLQFRLEVKLDFGVFGECLLCCVVLCLDDDDIIITIFCVAAVAVAISDLFQSSRLIDTHGMEASFGFVPRRLKRMNR